MNDGSNDKESVVGVEYLLARERTASHVHLDHLGLGPNIKIEDVHRHSKRRARIRNVDNTRNVALHGRTAEQQIDLVVAIPIAPKIFDDPETGLSICNRRIQIVLLAMFVNGESFESEIAAGSKLRLYGSGVKDGRLHVQLGHSVLDHGELESNHSSHFNGATE